MLVGLMASGGGAVKLKIALAERDTESVAVIVIV